MSNRKTTYEDYLSRGVQHNLRLLMGKDEIPDDVDAPVLWFCLTTARVFDASYHQLGNKLTEKLPVSPGQAFWSEFEHSYHETGARLGLELVYAPERGDFAPDNIRTPVKWRNLETGEIVVASLYKLQFGKANRFMKKVIYGNREKV